MNDEGERKEKIKEIQRREKKEKQKRNKENKCGEQLFIWRRVITIRQGEASAFVKGVIPKERENWRDRKKEGALNVKGKARETQRGKDRESKSGVRAPALKNIWEPSGSGEKNAGLSWNSQLPSLHCLPTCLLHIQLTLSPKRHKGEEGEYSLSGSRESPWALCSLLFPSVRKEGHESGYCIANERDWSEVNTTQNDSSCLEFIWSRKTCHIKSSPSDVCCSRVMSEYIGCTVLASISATLSPALADRLRNSTYDVKGGGLCP